jgi:hypothetical protein
MASLATLEQRIRALEARLAEVEGGYGDTLYRLRRDSIGTRIELGRLLDQAGVAPGERRGDRRDSGRRRLTPADASASGVPGTGFTMKEWPIRADCDRWRWAFPKRTK